MHLLELSDELLVEIISYFAGKERILDKRYYYSSMDAHFGWYRLPDLLVLASLAKTCKRVSQLARPAFYAGAGLGHDYFGTLRLQLALLRSQSLREKIRHLPYTITLSGAAKWQTLLMGITDLQHLEIALDWNGLGTAESANWLQPIIGDLAKLCATKLQLQTVRFYYEDGTEGGRSNLKLFPIMRFLYKLDQARRAISYSRASAQQDDTLFASEIANLRLDSDDSIRAETL